MNGLIPFLFFDQPCEQVQGWVDQKLTGIGFRLVQTFDLQGARRSRPECSCPHHGTEACNCQMVVLLAYRGREVPATLVIHGQDGKTWLSFATPMGRHTNQRLESIIRHTLTPRIRSMPSPVEAATYEAHSPA